MLANTVSTAPIRWLQRIGPYLGLLCSHFMQQWFTLSDPALEEAFVYVPSTPQACPVTEIEVAEQTFLKVAMSIN